MPTTTMTSWSRATSAVAPNLTSRKRKVIQGRIPIEPRIMSRNACWMSSWLIDRADRCQGSLLTSIGPKLACEGRRELAELAGGRDAASPDAGRRGGRTGRAPTAPGRATDATRRWGSDRAMSPSSRSETATATATPQDCRPGSRWATGVGPGDPLGPAELRRTGRRATDQLSCRRPADGDGLGDGLASGVSFVRISKYPSLVWMTSASVTPWSTRTVLTWSVVTFGFGELDLPVRAAGVVDRELQADRARW